VWLRKTRWGTAAVMPLLPPVPIGSMLPASY
jgi:hypothetical protein